MTTRSRSSSSSSDGGPPEITLDALSADTLAALNAHLAVKEAAEVNYTSRVAAVNPLLRFPAADRAKFE